MSVLSNPLSRLRTAGYAEGASFLLLLGVAMPLKYAFGLPQAVFVVGSIHGVLFLLYVAAIAAAARAYGWGAGKIMLGLVASVMPFGPFVFDRSLRADAAAA